MNTTPKYISGCTPVTPYPKDSLLWHQERAKTIGASEVGAILSVSPYGSLLSVVLDKRDALNGNPNRFDNPNMAMGRMAESTILGRAAELLGEEILPGEAVKLGDISATPDGLIFSKEHPDLVSAVVEAKLDRSGKDWNEVTTAGVFTGLAHLNGTKDIRMAYWWQVQTQMYVTGARRGILAVWTVYDFHVIEVTPEPAAFDAIRAAASAAMAWVNHKDGLLPQPTDADSLTSIARTIHPAEEGPVEASAETAEAIEEYARLSAEIKKLEEQRDEAKRVILAAHNSASKLTTSTGFKSSFVDASERITFDSKAFAEQHPDLHLKFSKITKVSASCRVTAPRVK